MSALYFVREGKNIRLLGFQLITDENYVHSIRSTELPEEWIAELLRRNLNERLEKAIIKIQRTAYNEGWKDAKAKRRKETIFSNSLYIEK